MGQTLHDSKPNNKNTVNELGNTFHASKPCFFLHSGISHESSRCLGIVHDYENQITHKMFID